MAQTSPGRPFLVAAQNLVDTAAAASRRLSASEKTEIETLLRKAEEADQALLARNLDLMLGVGKAANRIGTDAYGNPIFNTANASFGDAVLAAGWDLKNRPSVMVATTDVIGRKSTFPAAEDLNQENAGLIPIGQDLRFLHEALPTTNLGNSTAIRDFRQTAREVEVESGTGTDVERDIDSTLLKANLSVDVESVLTSVRQFAVTIGPLPNVVLEAVDSMRAFLDSEGRYQVRRAIDSHVIDEIIAASPASGGDGATMIEKVRNGISVMRAVGANPTILAASPETAAGLDLSTTGGDSAYVFASRDTGSSSPLWGVRVVESPALTGDDPILIDPEMLGRMYLGNLKFDANPFSDFESNQTTLRVEVNGLYHIRNIDGALVVDES